MNYFQYFCIKYTFFDNEKKQKNNCNMNVKWMKKYELFHIIFKYEWKVNEKTSNNSYISSFELKISYTKKFELKYFIYFQIIQYI